jgi:membrane peptidoglycan carboxypeptidase
MAQPLNAAGRSILLLRASLIAGVVVAVVTFPVVAAFGIATKFGSSALEKLPSKLTIVPPPQTSYVYASDGTTLITSFYAEDRKYTPLNQTAPYVQEAIISAEDSRFFQHHGVDYKGAIRAFVANNHSGEVSQGASTLTMQYVRNQLRDSAKDTQSVVDATAQNSGRKLREMKLAIELEKQMTKQQILEGYLNVAYFGHRAYGIYAASEIYFSKAPADLTLAESAMIAGMAQAPSSYDPVSDQKEALNRRNWVLDRMASIGYLSPQAAAQAKTEPITLHLSDPPNDCAMVDPAHNDWGFFCDEFKQWWMSQAAFGDNPLARLDNLRTGGYKIVTSLDPKVQAAGMKHVLDDAPTNDKYALGLVVVEPGTGLIKSMAVNRVYNLDQSHNSPSTDPGRRAGGIPGNYPNTVNMLLGGGGGGYQAGSTFKMFTMLAALEKGLPLNTQINAPMKLMTPYLTGPGTPSSCGNYWCPSNASAAMTGVQTMYSGFGKSVNTYWVQVEERIGASAAVAMAQRLGLTWHTDVDQRQAQPEHANSWGAFTLGVADTTPLEMANAYATVAADGVYCQPNPVLSITSPNGQPATMPGPNGQGTVLISAPRCTQAVSQDVARAAADAARCPVASSPKAGGCGGWSTAPGAAAAVGGRPFAGKTGTTDDTRAAWFIGMTPQLAGASFVADPDNPFDVAGDGQSNKPIDAVTLTIRDALAGQPVKDFQAPSAAIVGAAPKPAPAPPAPAKPNNGRR